MKCIIVDDEELAIGVIANYIGQISGLEIIGTYSNAPDAFVALQQSKVDILFLDIQMPKMTGFHLLQTLINPPHIIITTAYREFAADSYDFNVADYLVKPIPLGRFMQAISKIYTLTDQNYGKAYETSKTEEPTIEPAFIYIKSDRQFVKVILDEILYIESIKNHVKIVTQTASFITLLSISQIEQKMPPQRFIRIHRSYILSLSKIASFSQSAVTIKNKTLPIGLLYKNEVMKRLNSNVI